MNREKFEKIMRKHSLWLKGDPDGVKACFTGADFRGADFSRVDFREVDFRGAGFTGVDFSEVDFRGANFRGTDFSRVDFREVDFRWADFIRVDFSEAGFTGADFRWADFRWADFSRVDFRWADFGGVDFRWVDFGEANFREADFGEANFGEAQWDYTTVGIHPAAEGSLVGWGKKQGVIVKMIIPENAKRSCATTRKHRAEYAYVLGVYNDERQVTVDNRWGRTTYTPGQIVYCHKWEEDRWIECAGGIHFFLSRKEAEAWRG
jgi:hypothetical protein